MSADEGGEEVREESATSERPVPDWEDEYLDRVSDRLMHNYDLKKDFDADGELFDLYGQMRIESQKQFLHPSLNYANHGSQEHLFARRVDGISRADVETLVEFGHHLADVWLNPDEEHFSTDFTFVLVAPHVPEEVRGYVSGFTDRTLIKYGYYGHYEVNLVVVAPAEEDIVASKRADVRAAFTLWDDVPAERPGFVGRMLRRLKR